MAKEGKSVFPAYLISEEVAPMIGVSIRTLCNMANRGEIPGMKIGALWRFPAAAVKAWIREKKKEYVARTPPKSQIEGVEAEAVETLAPIAEEIQIKNPSVGNLEAGWDPDHHVELTLRVSECHAVIRLLAKLTKRTEDAK